MMNENTPADLEDLPTDEERLDEQQGQATFDTPGVEIETAAEMLDRLVKELGEAVFPLAEGFSLLCDHPGWEDMGVESRAGVLVLACAMQQMSMAVDVINTEIAPSEVQL